MTTGYSAADFEGHLIAHKDDHIALRTHDDDAPWTLFLIRRDHFMSPAPVCSSQRWLADNGWTPGPPPRNGNEQANEQARIDHIQEQDRIIRRRNEEIESLRKELDKVQGENAEQRETILGLDLDVRIRDKRIEEQDAKIEDLRKAVWERGEIIGDLREDLAAAEARVPSTPEEALTLAWELAHEVPEGQVIPTGTRVIRRFDDGAISTSPKGGVGPRYAVGDGFEARTLAPLPAPRPKHAALIGGVLIAEVGMHDDDARDTADKIARAIEEQETDDE